MPPTLMKIGNGNTTLHNILVNGYSPFAYGLPGASGSGGLASVKTPGAKASGAKAAGAAAGPSGASAAEDFYQETTVANVFRKKTAQGENAADALVTLGEHSTLALELNGMDDNGEFQLASTLGSDTKINAVSEASSRALAFLADTKENGGAGGARTFSVDGKKRVQAFMVLPTTPEAARFIGRVTTTTDVYGKSGEAGEKMVKVIDGSDQISYIPQSVWDQITRTVASLKTTPEQVAQDGLFRSLGDHMNFAAVNTDGTASSDIRRVNLSELLAGMGGGVTKSATLAKGAMGLEKGTKLRVDAQAWHAAPSGEQAGGLVLEIDGEKRTIPMEKIEMTVRIHERDGTKVAEGTAALSNLIYTPDSDFITSWIQTGYYRNADGSFDDSDGQSTFDIKKVRFAGNVDGKREDGTTVKASLRNGTPVQGD